MSAIHTNSLQLTLSSTACNETLVEPNQGSTTKSVSTFIHLVCTTTCLVCELRIGERESLGVWGGHMGRCDLELGDGLGLGIERYGRIRESTMGLTRGSLAWSRCLQGMRWMK